MPSITFNKAQKALGHLNKKRHPNGMQETPDLLKVKGWEKSKIIYELKTDIEKAFTAEVDRFRDLSDEGQKLEQERNELESKKERTDKEKNHIKEITEQIKALNKEVSEIFNQEREVRLSHKLTEEKFRNHITGDAFIDLDFAIEMNGTETKKEETDGE